MRLSAQSPPRDWLGDRRTRGAALVYGAVDF